MAVNRESTISHLYSPTGGVQPTPTDLEYGELAINISDGKIFFRGSDDSLKTVTSGDYVETFNGSTGAVEGVSSVNGQTGDVTVSGGGGTFSSSYAGHIYAPSEGTYYLDPRAPVGRTITEFYAICGTGGISADLYNSGATVGSLNVTPAGATASLSNTSLAQDGTLELVTSNYSACYDFRFAVRYTQ